MVSLDEEEAHRWPYRAVGAHAYRRNLGRACCPYGGWQREAWLGGWLDAAAAEDTAVADEATSRSR